MKSNLFIEIYLPNFFYLVGSPKLTSLLLRSWDLTLSGKMFSSTLLLLLKTLLLSPLTLSGKTLVGPKASVGAGFGTNPGHPAMGTRQSRGGAGWAGTTGGGGAGTTTVEGTEATTAGHSWVPMAGVAQAIGPRVVGEPSRWSKIL